MGICKHKIKQILVAEDFTVIQDLNENEKMVIEVSGTEYDVYTVENKDACILKGEELVYTSIVKRETDSRIKFEAEKVIV